MGRPVGHYGRWLKRHHPEHLESFAPLLDAHGGGDSDAPETKNNPIPRPWYHTDWVADRTLEFLDSLPTEADWFVWMSFPDPHHPWDPPASELRRVPWRELDLPPGHPGSDGQIRAILAQKPAHWLAYYEGRWQNAEGGPPNFRVPRLTHDNIREINAKVHVMNELIDDACGRVMRQSPSAAGIPTPRDLHHRPRRAAGRLRLHLQGTLSRRRVGAPAADWRPRRRRASLAAITQPVGRVDLAPTFCAIVGVDPAPGCGGAALPTSEDGSRERVLASGTVERQTTACTCADLPPRRLAADPLRAQH
jgi:hypothetical protein